MRNAHRSTSEDLRRIARDAMLQRGLLPEFSKDALAEVGRIAHPESNSATGIRELRKLLWSSIDNDDSRDLDQLTFAEEGPDGAIRVLVAVADVDTVVRKGSALDIHASTNTTSVYTAARIFPMLPEKLSTDLTSLNPLEERLAVVVEMFVASDGMLTDGDVFRALVFNHAKLAYNGLAPWLEGDGPAPSALLAVAGLDRQLRLQDQAAQLLRTERRRQGALRLETIEARPVFDGDALIDLQPDPKNRAKELIEDFMVAANGVTARYLSRKGYPSLRRVLHTPKRWDRIVALAAEVGYDLAEAPDAAALDAFLDAQRHADPDGFPDLSLSIVKLLGSGEYALELPGQPSAGHFGLAVREYGHSTAPNRRFPDLVVQRILKASIAGKPSPYRNDELATIARHCTVQEDNASKVERQVRKSAAAMLLASRVGDRFDGIITGASDKGTWVRINRPLIEGRIVRGSEGLDVGDHVSVELLRTDVERGYIDFVRAGRQGRR